MPIIASWKGTEIARSTDTVVVEGNHYFPRNCVGSQFLRPSNSTSVCPWKGTASYHSIVVGEETNLDAAWYYEEPREAAALIRDRIAFWKGIEVTEE